MKTLKSFLAEQSPISAYTEVTDQKEIKKWIKYYTDFKEKNDDTLSIYRGMNSARHQLVFLADGLHLDRVSANTANYYTEFLEVSPKWKSYPKRNKSFICSTGASYANSYGQLYHVLPLENQAIGIGPRMDFWDGFKDTLQEKLKLSSWVDLNEFNILLKNVFYFMRDEMKLDIKPTAIGQFMTNLELLNKHLEEVRQKINTTRAPDLEKILKFFVKIGDVRKAMETIFDPKKNQFFVDKYLNISGESLENTSRECWMSGKVLFIHESLI